MKATRLQHLRNDLLKELDATLQRSEAVMELLEKRTHPLNEADTLNLEWHKKRFSKTFELKQSLLDYHFE